MADLDRAGIKAVVDNLEGYLTDLRKMSSGTNALGTDLTKSAGHADGLGKSVASTAAGFAVAQVAMKGLSTAFEFGIGNAVKFEKGISDVGAVSGATKPQLEQLSKTALRIGADTSFSASQAVGAMQELAANGVSVTDIMGGAADAAASLAAAGGVDLPFAAATASTAMAAWGLKTSELNDVVNRLAGAANASRFGVDDMSQAIAAGGGAAATAGISFADFSTSIAATAASFSSGSDAGTSFKTFILNLTPTTSAAVDTMEKLGIVTADGGNAFFNAAGQAKPLAEIVQILHEKVSTLTAQEQVTALKNMFGADAFRTAAGLMKLTGDEFSTMSNKMRDTSAADVAKQRMDNLAGSFESLKGSIETLGIQVGTKLIPPLTELTQHGVALVNAFSALPSSTQNIVLLSGVMVALAPITVKAAGAAKTFFDTFQKGETFLQSTSGKITGIAAGIAAVTVAADFIVQKTTGHGIFEWIFGDPEKADRIAKVSEQLARDLQTMGKAADPVAVVLERIVSEQAKLNAVFAEAGVHYDRNVTATNNAKESIEAYAKALLEANAPASAIIAAHNNLSGVLQETFDKTVKYATFLPQVDAQNRKGAEGVEEMNRALAKTAAGLDATTTSTAALAPATQTATQAFNAMVSALDPDAKNAAKAASDALDGLIKKFSDMNPVVATLTGENAFLNEELDDLKAKGDAVTAAEKARMTVLEAAIKQNDSVIAGYQSNQKALEGAKAMLQNYIGAEGLGGLLVAMGAQKESQEGQIDLLRKTSSAYQHLQSGDIPGAITAFGNLKAELQPSEWTPLAAAIGPKMMEAIDAGISDPVEREKTKRALSAVLASATEGAKPDAEAGGKEVGKSAVDGVVAGIDENYEILNARMKRLANEALVTARHEIRGDSPSKEFQEKVGVPIVQGIEAGIIAEAPALFDLISGVAGQAVSLGAGVVAAALGGGVTLPAGILSSASGDFMTAKGASPGTAAEVAAHTIGANYVQPTGAGTSGIYPMASSQSGWATPNWGIFQQAMTYAAGIGGNFLGAAAGAQYTNASGGIEELLGQGFAGAAQSGLGLPNLGNLGLSPQPPGAAGAGPMTPQGSVIARYNGHIWYGVMTSQGPQWAADPMGPPPPEATLTYFGTSAGTTLPPGMASGATPFPWYTPPVAGYQPGAGYGSGTGGSGNNGAQSGLGTWSYVPGIGMVLGTGGVGGYGTQQPGITYVGSSPTLGPMYSSQPALGPPAMSPGGLTPQISIAINMQGAQLTGTLAENEAMMRRVVQTELVDQLGRGAFIAGAGIG